MLTFFFFFAFPDEKPPWNPFAVKLAVSMTTSGTQPGILSAFHCSVPKYRETALYARPPDISEEFLAHKMGGRELAETGAMDEAEKLRKPKQEPIDKAESSENQNKNQWSKRQIGHHSC